MTSRLSLVVCGALAMLLTGCPGDPVTPDAGPPPPTPPPVGTCAEQCKPYERCDLESHTCVPGCDECIPEQPCVNGCPESQTCTGDGTSFVCLDSSTSCGGATCGAGQNACISDTCSCLTARAASGDTCFANGRFCEGLYNSVTGQGGTCRLPVLNEECTRSPGCAAGFTCSGGLCLRPCNDMLNPTAVCGFDEACTTGDGPQAGVCYWSGLFVGSGASNGCIGLTQRSDGSFVQREDDSYVTQFMPIAARCIPFAAVPSANHPKFTTPLEPASLTGTCVPVPLKFADRSFNYTSCKVPGAVPQYGRCTLDTGASAEATSCGSGLTCVGRVGTNGILEESDEGVCLDVCNAATAIAGEPAQPSCEAGFSCLNYTRETDRLGVIGACGRDCNVFGGQANFGCTTETGGGLTTTFACVPAPADGSAVVSNDGSGFCIAPALTTGALVAAGQPCAVTDPFQGASCASGLVCVPGDGVSGTCRKPCDLGCTGANPPARCASLQNTGCSGGRTCRQASADPLSTTGICE